MAFGRVAIAVEGWRERIRAHADSSYVHLIVNEGPLAGASLEHSHAQLYALEFVPAEIARELGREAEDGTTLLHVAFDKAASEAVENGSEAAEVVDPEDADGE